MFKKILTGLVISAIVSPAFSAQDIYLTFKDGKTAVYKNLDDNVDNDQFAKMVMRDYGKDFYSDLDTSKSRVVDVTNQPVIQTASYNASEKEEAFCSSTTCKVVVGIATIAVLGYALNKLSVPALATNPCVLPSDRARDGSLCGGRASSVRPGGR